MITAIKEKVADLWERKTHLYTNFFISDNTLLKWNQENALQYFSSADSLLIVHDNHDFLQGYIYTINLQDAKKLLRNVFTKVHFSITMDIIGENDDLAVLLESLGFKHEATLQRMTRQNITSHAKEDLPSGVTYVMDKENDLLIQLLAIDFNPLIKQLPTKDELHKLGKENNIIATRTENGEIRGYLIAEQQGIVLSLRFIDVLPPYRQQGMGHLLLNAFLNLKDGIKKHQLWVKNDNIAAISLYQKYDFHYDGLCDKIYVMEANKQNHAI